MEKWVDVGCYVHCFVEDEVVGAVDFGLQVGGLEGKIVDNG